MSPVVNLVYQQEKYEGHFRYQHMHVRTQSESIAFLGGEQLEKKIADIRLNTLLKTQEALILRQLFLGFSVNFTDYLGSILSFLILSVPLFSGYYDNLSGPELSKLISANGFVSIYLIFSLTSLVDLSSALAIIGGTTHRISQLILLLESADQNDDEKIHVSHGDKNGCTRSANMTFIELHHVTVCQFRSLDSVMSTELKTLISDLSLRIVEGDGLLIWGPSGCGKTAILRVLRNLWQPSAGTLWINPLLQDDAYQKIILFLPQRPFLSLGNLRQQLTYPDRNNETFHSQESLNSMPENSRDAETDNLRHYLNLFGLDHLLERVDGDWEREVSWSWENILSPGEVQRLSFIRVFHHRPSLVFLDEATSSVSLAVEELFYRELEKLKITVVSCGHRESLKAFHDMILTINDDSSYSLQELN